MDHTARLELPLLAAGQAQKHVTHNEALLRLDVLVQLAVLSRATAEPPATPSEGDAYLVPAGATGAWAGHDAAIALRQDGGWTYLAPQPGWRAVVLDEEIAVIFLDGAWRGEGATPTSLANLERLGIGTAADAANPFAARLNAALWTAREATEGGTGDLRFTFNKETAADTASLLFQSGYAGHAEIGLAGDDNWRVKVSGDGSAWNEALVVDRATGAVGIGAAPAHRLSVAGIIAPAADNAYSIGTAARRASVGEAATGTISTSDAREKTDIASSDLGLAFVQRLKPRAYRWVKPEGAGRRHYGLVAQEVAQALAAEGCGEFGGFVLADPADAESRHGLRYEEFVAPLVSAVQDLAARLERLEAGTARPAG